MMFVYAMGADGPEISAIKEKLKEFGCYQGPISSQFDALTLQAVIAFQRAKQLAADGKVGDSTWSAMFGVAHAPCPGLVRADLLERCIAVTGVFETGRAPPDCYAGLSGDFDGQGLSFGVLQQNFGQRSLQPLLRRARDTPGLFERCFTAKEVTELSEILAWDDATRADYAKQMAWARSISDPSGKAVVSSWALGFTNLGKTLEYRHIQHDAAQVDFDHALNLCRQFGLQSERAVAFMFDVVTQNGSISRDCVSEVLHDMAKLPAEQDGGVHEVAVMEIIAERRSEYANPIWRKDVLARKTALAHGEGTVHGSYFNLSDQFGISLASAAALTSLIPAKGQGNPLVDMTTLPKIITGGRVMAAAPDIFPSGSWGIGPLNIQWSLKANNEVDVTVSVLGITLDTLSGTLDQGNFALTDNINLLGVITGTIGIKAIYDQATGNGLHVLGRVSGPGFDTGQLDHIIIPW